MLQKKGCGIIVNDATFQESSNEVDFVCQENVMHSL